jgi:hypothetical protein
MIIYINYTRKIIFKMQIFVFYVGKKIEIFNCIFILHTCK